MRDETDGADEEPIDKVLGAVDRVRDAHRGDGVEIRQYGEASAMKWLNGILGDDFAKAEWTAVPLALGILLVAFGALVAALLPVALALTAFLAANGILALLSGALHIDETTNSVMLLMGLAVGVDYCLFYLRRERDERAAGRDPETALRIAAATSGRAVLVSGLTVMVAMAGMFFSGLLLFKGFAVATILVVCIAMLGSVTILPALLSWLGDRVEKGKVPFLGGRKRERAAGRRRPAGRISGALLRPVLAAPGVCAVLAGVAMLALAAPALGMKTEQLPLNKQMPEDAGLRIDAEKIGERFPGGPAPARVVLKADDVDAPRTRAALAEFTRTVRGDSGHFGRGVETAVHTGQDVAVIDVPLAGDGTDATPSLAALKVLRERIVPDTLGPVAADGQVYTAGELAGSEDFKDQLKDGIVPVLVFITTVTFLLMLVCFRSVPVALASIVLNLLSVGAAYGVMTAVFQHGWGASLFGTEAVGAIESWMPLFVLVVLFGLSMDYHVFVVSRIREAQGPGHEHPGGHRRRDPGHGPGGDRCGAHHGRGLRGLRDAVDAGHEADGCRALGGRAAGRDRGADGAAACGADAAGRAQLVSAARPARPAAPDARGRRERGGRRARRVRRRRRVRPNGDRYGRRTAGRLGSRVRRAHTGAAPASGPPSASGSRRGPVGRRRSADLRGAPPRSARRVPGPGHRVARRGVAAPVVVGGEHVHQPGGDDHSAAEQHDVVGVPGLLGGAGPADVDDGEDAVGQRGAVDQQAPAAEGELAGGAPALEPGPQRGEDDHLERAVDAEDRERHDLGEGVLGDQRAEGDQSGGMTAATSSATSGTARLCEKRRSSLWPTTIRSRA